MPPYLFDDKFTRGVLRRRVEARHRRETHRNIPHDQLVAERRIRTGWVKWWGTGPRPKGPNGERLCKMCPDAVAEGRREYCSESCSDQYNILTSPAFARRRVYDRDHGVCIDCGLDTAALKADFAAAKKADEAARRFECVRCTALTPEGVDFTAATAPCEECGGDRYRTWFPNDARNLVVERAVAARFDRDDFVKRATWGRALWEADHIVPVVEGGGMCGLDNLRTLCIPCHHVVTAALAKRTASRRRRELKHQGELTFAGGGRVTDFTTPHDVRATLRRPGVATASSGRRTVDVHFGLPQFADCDHCALRIVRFGEREKWRHTIGDDRAPGVAHVARPAGGDR